MMDKNTAPGFRARLFSLLSRLVIWYSIVTLLFRCPSPQQQQLLDSSPRICAPYLAVRLHVDPYLEPYYQAYAAPYVEKARPYAESFYGNIYAPASEFIVSSYTQYAAPRVAQGIAFGEHEWQRAVKPRIDLLQGEVQGRYQEFLGPHVSRVNAALSPTLETVNHAAVHQYRNIVLPSYQRSLPYLQSAYVQGKHFLVKFGVPYSVWLYHSSISFVSSRIWPSIRILYGRNVEPQLSKILERLSSYRDSKKLEAAVDLDNGPSTSFEESTTQTGTAPSLTPDVEAESPLSSNPDNFEATDTSVTTSIATSSTAPVSATPTVNSHPEEPQSKLTEELRRWQAKFARASDKGGEDLSFRIEDITARQVEKQAQGLGNALITRLDDTVNRALADLQAVIVKQVEALPEDPTPKDHNTAYSSVLSAIRSAGTSIKEEAQEIRIWKVKFMQETESLVQAATDSTLDVIDNIRDLGLQEIGLRWASMDDVTYQDWAEYHKLKRSFDDWRVQLQSMASAHDGLAKSRQSGEDVEDKGMDLAQKAAVELARLKDVAKWKIHAHDASDDFTSRRLSAAAARIGQVIKEKASGVKDFVQSITSTQGKVDSIVSVATESAISAASAVSSAVLESKSPSFAGSVNEWEEEEDDNQTENESDEATPQRIINKEQLALNVLAAVHRLVSQQEQASSGQSTASEEAEASTAQPIGPDDAEASISQLTRPEETEDPGKPDGAATSLEQDRDISDRLMDVAEAVTASAESATARIADEISRASRAAAAAAEEYEASAESAYGRPEPVDATTSLPSRDAGDDEEPNLAETRPTDAVEEGQTPFEDSQIEDAIGGEPDQFEDNPSVDVDGEPGHVEETPSVEVEGEPSSFDEHFVGDFVDESDNFEQPQSDAVEDGYE